MLSKLTKSLLISSSFRLCASSKQPPNNQQNQNTTPPPPPNPEQKKNHPKHNFFLFGAGAMGLLFGYAVAINLFPSNEETEKKYSLPMSITHPHIGGSWQLVDSKGQKITEKSMKGSYYIIYFGFCSCPDVCPKSLTKLSKALAKARENPDISALPLKILFVSVDPDRDTHEKIGQFTQLFDNQIIGVTGTNNDDPHLRDAMRIFQVHARKIEYDLCEDDQSKSKAQFKNNYTYDHSIIAYLMDDENNYITHLLPHQDSDIIAEKIVSKVAEHKKHLKHDSLKKK